MATSEAQKRAVTKYREAKIKRIPLDVSIDMYNQIKVAADLFGEPVNRFIKNAIQERLEKGR